ncbi:hypothetical protein TCON_2858, partial [Astathelohania contejeani]
SNLCSHLNIIDLADEDEILSLELDETEKICQIDISELVKKNLEPSNETDLNIIDYDIKVALELQNVTTEQALKSLNDIKTYFFSSEYIPELVINGLKVAEKIILKRKFRGHNNLLDYFDKA